jgi:glycosidase
MVTFTARLTQRPKALIQSRLEGEQLVLDGTGSEFDEREGSPITDYPHGYHPDALIIRFLNNNDTGSRFISNHGDGMTSVSTALLSTLPGVPCVYTTDEVGEFYSPYFDPHPLLWEENFPGLRDYHKKRPCWPLRWSILGAKSMVV